jgi:hypothetical protein
MADDDSGDWIDPCSLLSMADWVAFGKLLNDPNPPSWSGNIYATYGTRVTPPQASTPPQSPASAPTAPPAPAPDGQPPTP